MGSEASRRKTFQDWPAEGPVSPQDLARAGFFYIGPQDRVQCFCCGGMLDNWTAGDSPLLEHQRLFPKCQFALSKHTGSLPARDTSDSVDGQILSQLQRISEEEGEGNETVLTTRPAYPDMGVEQIRLDSFHNWPSASTVCPQQLARAGFFYTGQHDHVKCYYCDGGLRNWDRGDDPWREHAKWFPRCEFLLQSRGRAYVSSIQESSSLLESWGHGEDPGEVVSTPSTPGSPGSRAWLAWPAWRQSTVVKSVLQMGFEQNMVERLVLNKYRLASPASTSVSQLVSDLIQEEERSARETRAPAPMAPESSAPRREEQLEQITEAGPLSTEQQLQQLKEERTCKVCMYQVVSIVFVPCGHLVCSECAPNLQQCPICRAVIHGSVRTFLS